MRLVAMLLCSAFWFILCVCIVHWSCVFCDYVPRLCSVFLYCICVLRYPFVSVSCICALHFPAVSPVTQSLCSLRDFSRFSLHRFLHSAVGFSPTCRALSLASRGVVTLTHHFISSLSLLSSFYRLADLTARTHPIAPCLTWVLSGLELALSLFHSGVHQRVSPFPIVEKISSHAFHLRLPLSMKQVHNVFHASLLEPTSPNDIPLHTESPPPPVEYSNHIEFEVAAILDSRVDRRRKGSGILYLVQWAGFEGTTEEFSWEPLENMSNASAMVHEFHRLYPGKPRSEV